MDLELTPGMLLQVEVKNEILIGRLVFFDKKRGFLELDSVKNLNTGYSFKGSQLWSLKQIQSLNTVEDYHSTNNLSSNDNNKKEAPPLYLNCNDLDNIMEQIKELQYIRHSDDKYHAAIKNIKAQADIAVCLEPDNIGKRGKTSLIAIATYTVVYVFDMQCLGLRCRELYAVLQARRPRKAVHGRNQYMDQLDIKIEVTNAIFDTAVAYCLATHSNKPISFNDAIYNCFNIAPKFLTTDDYYTYKRPINSYVLETIAKRSILQLKLMEYLLHEKLLMPFYTQCDNLTNTFENRSRCENVSLPRERGYDDLRTSWNVGDD